MATVYIVFNRRKKLNLKNEGAIELCVTINRKVNYIGLGISVLPKLWDNKKREVKSNHEDWFEINNILNEKVKTINKYLFECELNNQIPELTDIKQILGKKHIKHKDTFIKFCREEIGRRNDLGNATIHHQLNKLDTIQEWAGGDFSFDKLTLSFIEDFDYYLSNERKLKQNTKSKYHALIKSYIRRAINNKLMTSDNNPYNAFKIRTEESKREFLTEAELKEFENVDLKGKEHLQPILDKFLFSCYTGLRFSDYQNIEVSNINFVSENEVYLSFKMIKVNTSINNMPLHNLFGGKSIPLILKYINEKYENKKLFPTHTEGYFNRSIKTIGTMARVHKKMSSHVGRHTFGSLLASKTNDPMLIKTLMGHKKIDTSMIYIKLSNKGVEDKLSKIKW